MLLNIMYDLSLTIKIFHWVRIFLVLPIIVIVCLVILHWAVLRHNGKRLSKAGPKSVDFSRYASSTWKGYTVVPDGSKSSKSVTFTSQENADEEVNTDTTGLFIESRRPTTKQEKSAGRSISTKILGWKERQVNVGGSGEDLDLWLAFLIETGLLKTSSVYQASDEVRKDTHIDDPDAIIRQLADYQKEPGETSTTHVRDDYEDIHRKYPGIFWDTVTTDDPDKAFYKLKGIIQNIVNMQPQLKPMFDIDFANLPHYTTVESRLDSICKEIAPHRLFY